MSRRLTIGVAAVIAGSGLSIASAQITLPTVPIGNPGNAADPTTGYGSVAYTYNIGAAEVTNAQYAAFLNAKAASDPFNLYNMDMAGSLGGITRSGSEGSYTYSTISGRENNPVIYVSFWDACRFANWLHNGQGSADTETGAYTLTPDAIANNTVTRNPVALWAIPSEDEWYKAAYHQPASQGGDGDNYWAYPTSSNAVTTAQANYNTLSLSPAGSYAANFYGTFDMGGNAWEWNEAVISSLGLSYRGLRGGSCFDDGSWGGGGGSLSLRSDSRNFDHPWVDDFDAYGFRVVQIPAPFSAELLALGGFCAMRRRRGGGR